MALAMRGSKKGPKSVPIPNQKFVLGSRPPGLRSPRIKPLQGQTQYGKTPAVPAMQAQNNPFASGAGFGNTMAPQESE